MTFPTVLDAKSRLTDSTYRGNPLLAQSGAILSSGAVPLIADWAAGAYSITMLNLGPAGDINFANSTTSAIGVINKAGVPWLHDYGTHNVFLGETAGNFTGSGNSNIAIGQNALHGLTSSSNNIAIGISALLVHASGGTNVAVGDGTLASFTAGTSNTAIGSYALASNVTGTGNVALGYSAGWYETGSNKLFIAPPPPPTARLP